MNSVIDATESSVNNDRELGPTTIYYPARLRNFSGGQDALFTHDQITKAVHRAKTNPGGVPKRGLLERLVEFLRID